VAIGVPAVPIFCLLVEAVMIGYDKSSLRRLLHVTSASAKNDLFYLLIRCSGLSQALIFVLSFGLGFTAAKYLERTFSIQLLSNSPYAIQFSALLLVHTFLFYWVHRLLHVRFLWEIHKVHHSAEELNVITPLRNHPLDGLINLLIYAVPLAVLGVSPFVATGYLALNAIYQCIAHSSIQGRSKWLEALIITPSAHRLHHSADPGHWDTNFGILTFWDWIFGTYLAPDDNPQKLGVADKHRFNTGKPFYELWAVFAYWARSVVAGSATQ
jgi:sterol desaturase/sphingolipid hydroxylase (fatty acid hydroxylase superfamily)